MDQKIYIKKQKFWRDQKTLAIQTSVNHVTDAENHCGTTGPENYSGKED